MLRNLKEEPAPLEQLRVSYVSEETGWQVIDLLGDDITVYQDVKPVAGQRHLPADVAYNAIIDGYNEVTDQLNIALELD